ncbi:MAG: hypothetical protein JKY89_10780 [Immundisolibacteraceae bacterium]|nr:hypothetical protein [Immundisolibacteraceae bacterium]
MLIFEIGQTGRSNAAQSAGMTSADAASITADLPQELLRTELSGLPEVSELQAVRHYTRLSQLNFSIDTQFYPLGSCTMKYNPRAVTPWPRWKVLPGYTHWLRQTRPRVTCSACMNSRRCSRK